MKLIDAHSLHGTLRNYYREYFNEYHKFPSYEDAMWLAYDYPEIDAVPFDFIFRFIIKNPSTADAITKLCEEWVEEKNGETNETDTTKVKAD